MILIFGYMLVLYAIYMQWFSLLKWFYIAMSAVHLVMIGSFKWRLRRAQPIERIRITLAKDQKTRGFLRQALKGLNLVLRFTVFALSWPALLTFMVVRQRDRTKLPPKGFTFASISYAQLIPMDHLTAITMMILATTTAAATILYPAAINHAKPFMVAVVVQGILRHSHYIFVNLPKKIRRNLGSP